MNRFSKTRTLLMASCLLIAIQQAVNGQSSLVEVAQPFGLLDEYGGDGPSFWLTQADVTEPEADAAAPVSRSRSRSRPRRLTNAPSMFGDIFTPGLLAVETMSGVESSEVTLPLAGGARTSKFSELNRALPTQRVYFLYNHYKNAVEFSRTDLIFDTADERNQSIDRYTVGIEYPFGDDLWSVELRMPFSGRTTFNSDSFDVAGGNVGNLGIILKRLIYEGDRTAVAVGMGIDTPTGSGIRAVAPLNFLDISIGNEAVHLLPYVGFLHSPTELLFVQGSAQLDIATNGNPVVVTDTFTGETETGLLTEQTLVYLDLAVGRWFYQNPAANLITGIAGQVELHYTTPLQDLDETSTPFTYATTDILDVLHITAGTTLTLAGGTQIRVGGVFPLRDDRFFDAEIQAAAVRRF